MEILRKKVHQIVVILLPFMFIYQSLSQGNDTILQSSFLGLEGDGSDHGPMSTKEADMYTRVTQNYEEIRIQGAVRCIIFLPNYKNQKSTS
jgi:hypothetical protein